MRFVLTGVVRLNHREKTAAPLRSRFVNVVFNSGSAGELFRSQGGRGSRFIAVSWFAIAVIADAVVKPTLP